MRNAQKSPRNDHPPEEMQVKVEHNGADITITFRSRNHGTDEFNVERLRIGAANNANQMHGAPMTSQVAWEGGTLVVRSVAKFGDQALRMTDRWTLSGDGQALTLAESHQFGDEPEPTEDMHVFERQPDAAWKPAPDSQPAEQVYKNIQILNGVPAERIPLIMVTFSRVLGVSCAYCHVEGAMEKEDKPAFAKARRMFQMRNWIAQNAKVNVACWSCHRGHTPPDKGPDINSGIWPADLALTVEEGAKPAATVYKNLKFFNSTAADLKSGMLFIAASLGVECSHCHVAGAWDRDDKPAKNAARQMLAMVRDTRREFTEFHIGCFTCHHGATKPEMQPPAG